MTFRTHDCIFRCRPGIDIHSPTLADMALIALMGAVVDKHRFGVFLMCSNTADVVQA